jgi:chromosome segregation ATPase
MAKPNVASPLVAAASAVDEELREYDQLARDAKHVELDSEKALALAARILESATTKQPQIQQKLRALVGEIEAAQERQQASLDSLVEVSRALAARAEEFESLLSRFATLGESAKAINQLTGELSARKTGGAPDHELLEGLRALESRIDAVIVDAEGLAKDAEGNRWPEIARQADAIRQQVASAKNKLALAHRAVSERAPS